jgi:hypothetical protein
MPVYCLSVHAAYACEHSGACCTAGWPIPVEAPLRRLLRADVLTPDASGVCGYFDRDTRLCRVHSDHGARSLPASCYHFPRRSLIDDRGTFVTLSHFCPTAARQLVDSAVPLSIVADPSAYPPDRGYDGLDARGEWPPLVRPNLLFDAGSYSRWERFVVETFARGEPIQDALASIAAGAERLRQWTPRHGPFSNWVEETLTDRSGPDPHALVLYARVVGPDACDHVSRLVPPDSRRHPAPSTSHPAPAPRPSHLAPRTIPWRRFDEPVRRYLATKAFASWTAYQSRGVRTIVAELLLSEVVLRTEAARACLAAGRSLDRELLIAAIRAADHLLMHLVDRAALTEWLGDVERM